MSYYDDEQDDIDHKEGQLAQADSTGDTSMSTPEQRAELRRLAEFYRGVEPFEVDAEPILSLLDELKAAEEDLQQIREAASMKEACGHSMSHQTAGEGGFYCLMCRALKAEARIAELESRKPEEGRWISVEERLPKQYVEVSVMGVNSMWIARDGREHWNHFTPQAWRAFAIPPAVSEAKEGSHE